MKTEKKQKNKKITKKQNQNEKKIKRTKKKGEEILLRWWCVCDHGLLPRQFEIFPNF